MNKRTRMSVSTGNQYTVYSEPERHNVHVGSTSVSLTLEPQVVLEMTPDRARLLALALIKAADESDDMEW